MYEEIRRIHLEEKNNNKLANVREDIYDKVFEHMETLRKQLASEWDPVKMRELENCEKVLRDIEYKRAQKIVLYAFNTVYNGFDEIPQMAEQERLLYDNVVKCIVSFREDLSAVGKNAKGTATQNNTKSDAEGIIKIRALKEIPRFKSINGNEYGPFRQGDVCEMPEKEARILVKKNIAENVE